MRCLCKFRWNGISIEWFPVLFNFSNDHNIHGHIYHALLRPLSFLSHSTTPEITLHICKSRWYMVPCEPLRERVKARTLHNHKSSIQSSLYFLVKLLAATTGAAQSARKGMEERN